MRARALFGPLGLLVVATGSVGCGDLLGFGDFQAICGPEANPKPGGRRWAARFGDAAAQQALAVAVDGDGAALVAGTFAGTLDTGGEPLASLGGRDAFVVKLAVDGQHVWSRAIGGKGDQSVERVAVGPGGEVVVVGRFNGSFDACGQTFTSDDKADTDGSATNDGGKGDVDTDLFVLALSADGACARAAVFPGYGDQAVTGLAVSKGGAVFLSGTFGGSLHLGGPCADLQAQNGTDVFVAGLDPTGACQWARQLDFGGSDAAGGLALDAGGRVWVTGACGDGTLAPCDAAGQNLLLSRVDVDPAAGTAEVTSWAFGGGGDQAGLGVIAGSGAVALTGVFGTSLDLGVPQPLLGTEDRAFLASLSIDVAGGLLPDTGWSKGFIGEGHQAGTALALDTTGTLALAGAYDGDIDLGDGALPNVPVPKSGAAPSSLFVGAFDAEGTVQWSRAFGDGKSVVTASGAAVDGKGDVVVVGSLSGAASCGEDPAGGTLESAGATDVFVARLRLR